MLNGRLSGAGQMALGVALAYNPEDEFGELGLDAIETGREIMEPGQSLAGAQFVEDAASETPVVLEEGQHINRVWDSRWTEGSPYSGPFGGSYSPGGALPTGAATAIESRGLDIPGVLNDAQRGAIFRVTGNVPALLRTSIGGSEPELLIAPEYRQFLELVNESLSSLPGGKP